MIQVFEIIKNQYLAETLDLMLKKIIHIWLVGHVIFQIRL
jgi:hypothetical protein